MFDTILGTGIFLGAKAKFRSLANTFISGSESTLEDKLTTHEYVGFGTLEEYKNFLTLRMYRGTSENVKESLQLQG